MKKSLKILKEIGIGIALILVVGVAAVIVFKERIPIAVDIPEPEVYVAVDKNEYLVATDGIENAQSATVIYQSTNIDLENYGSELRYISGATEPFEIPEPNDSDIPAGMYDK